MPQISKVQKAIPGLAKFLGIETQGVLRMETDNLVRPVLEMDDYLGPSGWTYIADAAVPQDGNLDIVVPDKTFWRVRYIGLWVDSPVGVNVNARVELLKPIIGNPFVISPPQAWQATGGAYQFLVNQSESNGFGFPTPHLNGEPGDTFRVQLYNESAAGNNTVRFWIEHQTLQL